MYHVLLMQDPTPSRLGALGPWLSEFWPILVPVLLGWATIYWLLPRGRVSPPLAGAALGALALILAGALLVHMETIWPETLLFYTFAGVAVVGGVLLITQHNPVYAALSFALVVLSTCGLFLLQAAPFLMAATIIIYAGAIVVTFLFVIMLAQQEGFGNADLRSREPFLATMAGFVLMASLLCVLHRTLDTRALDQLTDRLDQITQARTDDEVRRLVVQADEQRPGAHPRLVERLHHYLGDLHESTNNLAEAWAGGHYEMVKLHAARTLTDLRFRRASLGRLTIEGRPGPRGENEVEAEITRVVPGKTNTPGVLPHQNVAALGQTLFTDYLIPVELAAVLLLVATIGAIAIASRRSEELR